MTSNLKTYLLRFLDAPRYTKRAVLVVLDFLALTLVLWIALSFRYDTFYFPPTPQTAALLAAGPLITVAFMWHFGIYRMVTRFVDQREKSHLLLATGLSVLAWSLLVFMSGQYGVPRTVILFYLLIGGFVVLGVRSLIKGTLEYLGGLPPVSALSISPRTTLIYGANQIGIELLHAVRRARDRKIIGFIEASPTLWRQYVGGLKVYPPQRLARLIERENVKEILIALPGSRREQRKQVIRELERLPVKIKILPTYEDIASGKVNVESLRSIEVGDILGRDPVPPKMDLLKRSITGRSILVTGAGGSIGSEIVNQVTQLNPRRVVLLDISERNLYFAEQNVRKLLQGHSSATLPELTVVLGSVTDRSLLDQVIRDNAIETIFHAAAYKHVPLVESNPCAGVDNNVFGTRVVAESARAHGVERMVLISTDKAVRPTNIMGATKRLAELILQAMSHEKGSTIFSMVRFGNVLDSSGSVVPPFRQQIKDGGPITVTHPDATRYFMSIPEAAELVVQAGAMAVGGEVFVLNMGDPIRIDDLARLMIRLSNLDVLDAQNPNGDIGIVYTGLRPGEKLIEELLIGAHTQTTEHPRIFRADEPVIPMDKLAQDLNELETAIARRDTAGIEAVIARTVENYQMQGSGRTEVIGVAKNGNASMTSVAVH